MLIQTFCLETLLICFNNPKKSVVVYALCPPEIKPILHPKFLHNTISANKDSLVRLAIFFVFSGWVDIKQNLQSLILQYQLKNIALSNQVVFIKP